MPGGLGACAASQRRASRDKKSQLYETQSHKKYSTFTTKISVTVFRRSPSPAAAPMHIRFSHFASRKAQSREHTLHRAGARSVVHRATTQCRPPSPLPSTITTWDSIVFGDGGQCVPAPRPASSRGRQRPRFLQRFRVDYPSALPAPVARARRRARSASRAYVRPPVSPAARSAARQRVPSRPRGVRRTANPHELGLSSRPEPVAAVRAISAVNKRLSRETPSKTAALFLLHQAPFPPPSQL